MAKIKCVVAHPNLHLAVSGKLQQLKKDSTIEVEEKHVARHLANGSLKRFDDAAAIAVGGSDGEAEAKAKAEAELKALRERAAELNIANPGKMKAETLKAKIAEAEKAIAEANAAAGQ